MATLTSIPFPATISRSKPTLYPAADLNPIHPKSDRHPDHITLVGQLSIYCQFYQELLLQQSVLVQDLHSSCPIRYAFSRSLGKSFSCTNFFLLSSKLAIFSHSFKDRGWTGAVSAGRQMVKRNWPQRTPHRCRIWLFCRTGKGQCSGEKTGIRSGLLHRKKRWYPLRDCKEVRHHGFRNPEAQPDI